MRAAFAQPGLLPEFDLAGSPDYSRVAHNPLNRKAWLHVKAQGNQGASSCETARALKRPAKSIAGRFTELHRAGYLRATEVWREGVVYLAIGDMP